MTVIGDAFFMTIVTGNPTRHSAATPTTCDGNRLHSTTVFKWYVGSHAKLYQYILLFLSVDTLHVLIVLFFVCVDCFQLFQFINCL